MRLRWQVINKYKLNLKYYKIGGLNAKESNIQIKEGTEHIEITFV